MRIVWDDLRTICRQNVTFPAHLPISLLHNYSGSFVLRWHAKTLWALGGSFAWTAPVKQVSNWSEWDYFLYIFLYFLYLYAVCTISIIIIIVRSYTVFRLHVGNLAIWRQFTSVVFKTHVIITVRGSDDSIVFSIVAKFFFSLWTR